MAARKGFERFAFEKFAEVSGFGVPGSTIFLPGTEGVVFFAQYRLQSSEYGVQEQCIYCTEFAQLPLYGFASVAVDGLPNCHLRLLYNAWLSFRSQVFDRIFCKEILLWDTAPEITTRFSTLSITSFSFHSSLYLCCHTW
ncbi:hypothetical protein NC651_033101 [Populus alba x Populus x berolinensis]|nr:hypothetical protein NC651_033095 [Populus alba x Populus x berolinensis]KAJ6867955.1 hypothetical protein NC651_033101 [Populus alba x Populus x berolinensis]